MMGLRKFFAITVFATFCGTVAVTNAEASVAQQSELTSAQFGKGANKKSTSKKSKRKMRMKKKLRKSWY